MLYEPVFSILYDPTRVIFDPTPIWFDKCDGLVEANQMADQSFIFAHVSYDATEYYWIDGWQKYTPDGPGNWPQMFVPDISGGAIVTQRGTDCRATCAMCNFTTNERVRSIGLRAGITDDIAAKLLHAAIETEARAFGGKRALLKRIDDWAISHSLGEEQKMVISEQYPLVRREVDHLRDELQ